MSTETIFLEGKGVEVYHADYTCEIINKRLILLSMLVLIKTKVTSKRYCKY